MHEFKHGEPMRADALTRWRAEKRELHARAKRMGVEDRSKMRKRQLENAVR